jgi:hypothetical protein
MTVDNSGPKWQLPCGAERATTRIGTIYFLRGGEFVKIGFSAGSVKKRVRAFQVGNPYTLHVVRQLQRVPRSAECLLHKMFARKHVRGEWFRLAGHEVDFVSRRALVQLETERVRARVASWPSRACSAAHGHEICLPVCSLNPATRCLVARPLRRGCCAAATQTPRTNCPTAYFAPCRERGEASTLFLTNAIAGCLGGAPVDSAALAVRKSLTQKTFANFVESFTAR